MYRLLISRKILSTKYFTTKKSQFQMFHLQQLRALLFVAGLSIVNVQIIFAVWVVLVVAVL